MLIDDYSGYFWIDPSPATNAETAADSLIDLVASFGVPDQLMPDGPTHFKNESIRRLTKVCVRISTLRARTACGPTGPLNC